METESESWVALFTAGMSLNVVGLLLLDAMAWYVQYAALGLSVVLVGIAVLPGDIGRITGGVSGLAGMEWLTATPPSDRYRHLAGTEITTDSSRETIYRPV